MPWKNYGWMPNDTIFTLIKNLKDKKSLAIQEVLHKVAGINTNLLIYGETGVGKDSWVDYLFNIGNYKKIVNLNCGDVPETLLESEWFGYKRGAFTSADRDYEGKWKQAEGGILFLNQIDLLSLNIQAKLLRIIERKKFFPLGSSREVDIDVRFVFSADHDIEQKVRQGLFREDLFYRIAAYRIHVPPLRERKKDVLSLFIYFAGQKELRINVDKAAWKLLQDYHWPGNIRELENFVINLSIMKKEITNEDIYGILKTSGDFFEAVKYREMSLGQLEKEYIQYLLKKYKNKAKVAKILQIARKSLYNKLDSYK
ncbi:MAG: sigma 54-interacting transcriptional regulator [Acidobacteria bacterium]|jgi:two-component system NtrC family response regulator|nr:sigma 54-interacting transcriptional regulator [Acidobacteriota bacterium]